MLKHAIVSKVVLVVRFFTSEFNTREFFVAVLRDATAVSKYKISISSIYDVNLDPEEKNEPKLFKIKQLIIQEKKVINQNVICWESTVELNQIKNYVTHWTNNNFFIAMNLKNFSR